MKFFSQLTILVVLTIVLLVSASPHPQRRGGGPPPPPPPKSSNPPPPPPKSSTPTPTPSKTTASPGSATSSGGASTTTTTCQASGLLSTCTGLHVAGQASTTYYSGCCAGLTCSATAGLSVCVAPGSSSNNPPKSTYTTCQSSSILASCSGLHVAGEASTTYYNGCCRGLVCTTPANGVAFCATTAAVTVTA